MRRLLILFLLCSSAWATTTVTGVMQTLGNSRATGGFMRFWLRGCAGNQPRVNGQGIIAPTLGGVFYFDFPADVNGVVSGVLFSNRDSTGLLGGEIECGGSTTATWYGMQAFFAGKGGPETPVYAKNGGSIAIDSVTPITVNPVVTPPTGDSTYARLDGGNQSFTGGIAAPSFDRIEYADQLTPSAGSCGVSTGVDASAKLQCAINLLPSGGGVVDARNLLDAGGIGSTSIDPGSRKVSIWLGPYTYNVKQITLRTGFAMIGSTDGATSLQSMNGNNPVFVLPQANNSPAQRVYLKGFQLIGSAGNTTEDGFNLDCSGFTNSGLWYSLIEDVALQGFNGVSFRMRGRPNDFSSSNQFDTFIRFDVFRGSSVTAGEALRIEGSGQNIDFVTSTFMGPAGTHHLQDIYLGTYSNGSQGASSTIFWHSTIQAADVGVNLNGTFNVAFRNSHFEGISTGAFLFTNTTGTAASANLGDVIDSNYFAADGSFANSGNGYLVSDNIATYGQYDSFTFANNLWGQFSGTPPDHVFLFGNTSATDPIFSFRGNIGPGQTFPFAGIFACTSSVESSTVPINDSSTATWGANISNGGSNHVLGYCDGTNWTVAAK